MTELDVSDRYAFDIFLASVMSIQYHPANPPESRMTPEEAIEIVDRILKLRKEYFEKN